MRRVLAMLRKVRLPPPVPIWLTSQEDAMRARKIKIRRLRTFEGRPMDAYEIDLGGRQMLTRKELGELAYRLNQIAQGDRPQGEIPNANITGRLGL